MKEVNEYVGSWLKNQAIWRINNKEVTEILGNDLSKWQNLLKGINESKLQLEMENSKKLIGCISINVEQIQSSISMRYDSLEKDLLSSFSMMILTNTSQFESLIIEQRNKLERLNVNSSTSDAIDLILLSREIAANLPLWKNHKNTLLACHTLLEEQDFTFPPEWIYSQQVENDWSSLEQILAKRQDAIQKSQEQLKNSIIKVDTKLKKDIDELSKEWEEKKPQDGTLSVDEALKLLLTFERKMNSLTEIHDKVNKGRNALLLDISSFNPLESITIELHGLYEAWNSVQMYWKRIESLGNTLWSVFVPKTFHQSLLEIERDIEKVSSRVKNYDCFIYLKNTLASYSHDFKLLQEIKNSAFKERHWISLLSLLQIHTSYEYLRVRDFWIPAFHEKEQQIVEILSNAQGELAIEEFLKQVREIWTTYQLELVNYHERYKLIRGWEDLFTKLDEHISALSSMKQSPYYKVFAEEATNWEDKVIRMRVLFDTWIDVQRRWIYLEGIFMSAADIKHQLPQEFKRFVDLDREYNNVMQKVAARPMIMDVFNTSNIQRTLERYSQQLTKIQKSLGELLEKQRQSFSRFYFVGDEDLLEIIGNSNDPVKVQRHLNKMFAGINSLEYENQGTDYVITAMVSKEGEIVPFHKPIIITPKTSIVIWLSQVEKEMRETLAL